MDTSLLLMFSAMLATHFAWRAGTTLNAVDWQERPLLYSRLGVLGSIIPARLPVLAMICAVATVAWGFIYSTWYTAPVLFVVAGPAFSLPHSLLYRLAPAGYSEFFLGLGSLLGFCLLIASQLALWVGHRAA